MVVRVIPSAVVTPSRCRVDEPRPVELVHHVYEADFGIRWSVELAPSFVVDDLEGGREFVSGRSQGLGMYDLPMSQSKGS